MEGDTVVVTGRVGPERMKLIVDGENRMLIEVVDPEPLTADHVPFRKETAKRRHCQLKEAFSGERKSTGDSVVIIEKGERRQSLTTFSSGGKEIGRGDNGGYMKGGAVPVTADAPSRKKIDRG